MHSPISVSSTRLVSQSSRSPRSCTPPDSPKLGIDVMNMHHTDWNGGLVVLFHRFDVLVFSWDLQFDHQLEDALRMGVDAVYSDHSDTMMDAMAREVGLSGT